MQATLNILPQTVKNNLWPKEGPQAVPLTFDFTVANAYAVDLGIQAQQRKFSFIQTVYVDNSANAKVLTIAFDVLNQQIQVPAHMQGYFPVLVMPTPRLTVTSAGGSTAMVFLLNFPVAPAMWAGTGSALLFDVNGNLLVSDTLLESAIAGGKLQAQNYLQGNGDVVMPMFGGNELLSVTVSALGNTVIIPAQGVGVGWFLKYLDVWISGNASLAVAGNVTLEIRDNALVLARSIISLPAAAGIGFGQNVLRLDNMNYNAKAANLAMNANLSVALATGSINVTACWGSTTNVTP